MGNVREKKASTVFVLAVVVLALAGILIVGFLFYRSSSSNPSFVSGLTGDDIYAPGTAPEHAQSSTSEAVNNNGRPVDEVFGEELWKGAK